MPNSSLTSRSCAAVKTGPSLQTRYLPITQLPHKPMPQRIKPLKTCFQGKFALFCQLKNFLHHDFWATCVDHVEFFFVQQFAKRLSYHALQAVCAIFGCCYEVFLVADAVEFSDEEEFIFGFCAFNKG